MLHPGLDLSVSHNGIIALYFFASLSFLVAGLGLSLFTQTHYMIGIPSPYGNGENSWTTYPYEDLGFRLYCFGIFLVAATFYQSLASKKKKELLQAL